MYQRLLRPCMRLAVSLVLIVAAVVHAQDAHQRAVTMRPLADFLTAQGTTSQFVPPVPDYVGWIDGSSVAEATTFALIDYAGLANEFIETESGGAISLKTRVRGRVIERERPDGSAAVRVRLLTTHALLWAFALADVAPDDQLPFLNTPLSFGARAQDVLEGAKPSVGVSALTVHFINTAPDAALPDLVQLINTPEPDQVPLRFAFRAAALGTRPDGSLALLRVRQVCRADLDDQGAVVSSCTTEIVDIVPLN